MARVRVAVLITSARRAQQLSIVTEVAHINDLFLVTYLAATTAVVTEGSGRALTDLVICCLYLCRTRRAIVTLFPVRRTALKNVVRRDIRLVVVNEAIERLQRIRVGKIAVVVRILSALGAIRQSYGYGARRVVFMNLVAGSRRIESGSVASPVFSHRGVSRRVSQAAICGERIVVGFKASP